MLRKYLESKQKKMKGDKSSKVRLCVFNIDSLLLMKRRVKDHKPKIPELGRKYAKFDQDVSDFLNKGDTSLERLHKRIKDIQELKYSKQWKARQFVDRLYTTSNLQKEAIKSRLK